MRWLLLFAALVSNAAAAPPTVDPAVKLANTVIVWNDATFYLDADPNGPKLQLGVLDGAREDNVGFVVPLHVLGTTGDFVEVEPVAGADCGWTTVGIPTDLARLRVYVKRADLAPVVTRPVAKIYKDGTSIDVKPGLPVLPVAGAYRVSLERGELELPIPATAIGYSYTFAGNRPKDPNGAFTVAANTKVTLGERTFELADELTVPAIDKRKDTSFISLSRTCMKARFAVPNAAISNGGKGYGSGYGIGGGGKKVGERWVLPKGTALFAPGLKRQVAVTANEVDVAKPDGKPESCIVREWRIDIPYGSAPWTKPPKPTPMLMVCAPATAVQHIDAPARP